MRILFSLIPVLTSLAVARAAEEPAPDAFGAIQRKIVSFTLENGLKVILCPRGSAPVISCITYVKTGSVDEVAGITGIAHQLEHLAFKGTSNLGTTDAAAEQKVLTEIDALYEQIQVRQQKLLGSSKEALLVLLARLSSGGPEATPEKVKTALAGLRAKWERDGDRLADEDFALLESMVIGWTAKVREAESFVVQNQYSNVIDRAGGSGLNAFTSSDRTVYQVSLPASRLELWAALESDRFMNTVPRQLEKEKQVVLEERRMRTESNPFGKLYENFLTTAFKAHPYGTPVIGHRSDILNYTRASVLDFYRLRYTPRNTIVAVVGDLDVEKARATLTAYFGKIPAAPLPPEPHTTEPKQDGERRVDVEFPAQQIVMLGYHIPERKHPDTPALTVLSEVLSSGRSSRFYQALVKRGLALSANAWLGPGERYPRLFIATAEQSEAATIEQVEDTLLAEIERAKTVSPTVEEMLRVQAAYKMDVLQQMRNNLRFAINLADYEALAGDWRELFREVEAVGGVTPEQVSAVAVKYLVKKSRTTARLISTEPAEAPAILGVPAQAPKP